MHHKN